MKYLFTILIGILISSCASNNILVVKSSCKDHPQLKDLQYCEKFKQ